MLNWQEPCSGRWGRKGSSCLHRMGPCGRTASPGSEALKLLTVGLLQLFESLSSQNRLYIRWMRGPVSLVVGLGSNPSGWEKSSCRDCAGLWRLSRLPALCNPTDEHSALLHAWKGFAGAAGSMGIAPSASECGQFESLCAQSHSREVPKESLGTGMGWWLQMAPIPQPVRCGQELRPGWKPELVHFQCAGQQCPPFKEVNDLKTDLVRHLQSIG